MRLVIISDTHTRHEELETLAGDVLIHCGDFCNGFIQNESDLFEIDRWFGEQPFERILCTGGNHDFVAQQRRESGEPVFENAIYLEGEAYEYGGLTFYGAPWIPRLEGWAYCLPDDELAEQWKRIPQDTDVLITHTPPAGILDIPSAGHSVGCSSLRAAIEDLPSLRIHCFGHVHASYGQWDEMQITFYNAAVVGSNYAVKNSPIVVEL